MRQSGVADPLGDDTEEEAGEEHALLDQRAMDLIQPEFSEQNWSAFVKGAIDVHSAGEVAESIGVNPQVIRQANYLHPSPSATHPAGPDRVASGCR